MESRFKIFSDPVHGFISVPKNVILDLIESAEVQRLRRIRQLGMGHMVFPGAEHSRFGHALGAMALMQDALATLVEKGTPVSPEEHTAALAAALLHDIGHGPFSHTLEHDLMPGVPHEAMSRALIMRLNEHAGGRLDLTLRIFDGTYERSFFHALVSGQLDVDRLDYLRRDSFYTGVVEGEVGVQRLIKTLRVEPTAGGADSHLVVESKGIYAVENFLLSRRLMYGQVYLHKTVLAGDAVLRAALHRVRAHLANHKADFADTCAPALLYFLTHTITLELLSRTAIQHAFCALDDADILTSLKRWMLHDDPVLADLSQRFINRRFPGITFLDAPPDEETRHAWLSRAAEWLVSEKLAPQSTAYHDAHYYVTFGHSRTARYDPRWGAIRIRERDGRVREFSKTSEYARVAAYPDAGISPYVVHPKTIGTTGG